MSYKKAALQEVTWDDVRGHVENIAPDIYQAIERLAPDRSYKLYKASYPYGSMIIGENGVVNLPVKDEAVAPLIGQAFPQSLKDELGYNWFAMPLGLVLQGQVELFIEEEPDKVETHGLYGVGVMLAGRVVLDPSVSYHARHFWRMTSGARAVFMLPSIADRASYNRLKDAFNLRMEKPATQKDHWRLFVTLSKHDAFADSWKTEMLYFSKKWLEPRTDDAWKLFRLALLERSWSVSSYIRNKNIVDRIWLYFLNKLRDKKATTYVTTIARHLIEAGLGQAIVHMPDDGTNTAGPFNTLADVFIDIYSLKKYAPILMVPGSFDLEHGNPGYFSIQRPHIHTARKNNADNLIADTREIKYVLRQFREKILSGELKVDDTPLYNVTHVNYEFYHADPDKFGELLPSAHIFDNDKNIERWREHPINNQIAYRNEFLRSCVKIIGKGTDK